MAYPKITVNTGTTLQVVGSDSIPIPASDLPKLSGQITSADTNKLIDTHTDFSNVSVGDIVYNTTDKSVATVLAIDVGTNTLTLSASIFSGTLKNYTIFLGGPNGSSRIKSSEGCLLYVGSSEATMTAASSYVNVTVKTVSGSDVTFSNFPVGEYLPVQVIQLYTTGTSAAAENNCVAIW